MDALTTITDTVAGDRRTHPMGVGEQARLLFANNYGVSVIKAPFSYGIEMAVMHVDSNDTPSLETMHLCYSTPITSDVVGHISSQEELLDLVRRVQALPANPLCTHARPDDADPWEHIADAIDSIAKMPY